LHEDMLAMVGVSLLSITNYHSNPEQIKKSVEDKVLSGHKTFFIKAETKDVDAKFSEVLKSIEFDVDGKLAQPFRFGGRLHHHRFYMQRLIELC
jgi:hypothetical protein